MCTYLHKAPNGVYYFHMGIPVELRPRFDGRREIKHSLRTKDRDEAKRLIPDQTKAALRLLEQAKEAGASVPAVQPAAPLSRAVAARLRARAGWDREQLELSEIEADEIWRQEEEREQREPLADHLAMRLASPDAELTPVEAAAKDLLADQRFELELANEQAANARMARYVVSEQPAPETKGKGLYVDTEILEGWAAERKPSARGKAAYESSARLFNSIMGRKSAELITKADVMAYKQKLIADPARSQTNVRDHLAYLRTLLDWAAQNDVIDANPAKDVRMRVMEKGEARKDFDIDDLSALFAGPVHAKGERPKGCGGEAAYWLPLASIGG